MADEITTGEPPDEVGPVQGHVVTVGDDGTQQVGDSVEALREAPEKVRVAATTPGAAAHTPGPESTTPVEASRPLVDVTQGIRPREGEEIWEMQVESTVALQETTYNRMNQPIERDMLIGPRAKGKRFRIRVIDREYNQGRCVDPKNDPFRNGMLVRISAFDVDPYPEAVESIDSMTADDLVALFDLEQDEFEQRVSVLGEVPLRRLADMAEPLNASAQRVEYLSELVRTRFQQGGPNPFMASAFAGESLSEPGHEINPDR